MIAVVLGLALAPVGSATAETTPTPTGTGASSTATDPAPDDSATATPAPTALPTSISRLGLPAPTAPTPSRVPATTQPYTIGGLSVRVSLECASCSNVLGWTAGTGSARVSGMTLPAKAGLPVSIYHQAPGAASATLVATVVTDATGRFTWTGPMAPAGTNTYQAIASGVPSAKATATVVTPSLTIAGPASTDTLVNPVMTGLASPRNSGLEVRSEVLVKGAWSVSQRTVTKAGGAYSLPLTYGNGVVGPVTVRTAMTLPGGRVIASPAKVVNRVAVMNPVVRATVAADVPKTYRAGCPVGPASLRTIDMNHWGFDGRIHRGRLVIRTGNVTPIINAMQVAFTTTFPIREMRDASVYGGDDIISMEHDNTNAFNCRRVTGNPYRMSPHSYGTSIDINTVENPYQIPSGVWLPKNGQAYVARSPYRPGMITPGTPLAKAMLSNGFTWLTGYDWQHFQR